jgi:hypothetical protein
MRTKKNLRGGSGRGPSGPVRKASHHSSGSGNGSGSGSGSGSVPAGPVRKASHHSSGSGNGSRSGNGSGSGSRSVPAGPAGHISNTSSNAQSSTSNSKGKKKKTKRKESVGRARNASGNVGVTSKLMKRVLKGKTLPVLKKHITSFVEKIQVSRLKCMSMEEKNQIKAIPKLKVNYKIYSNLQAFLSKENIKNLLIDTFKYFFESKTEIERDKLISTTLQKMTKSKYEFIEILDKTVKNMEGKDEEIKFKYFYKSTGTSRNESCSGTPCKDCWLPTDVKPLKLVGVDLIIISKAEDTYLANPTPSCLLEQDKYKHITEESIYENYRYMNSTYARIGKYFEELGEEIYTKSE